MPCDKYTPDYQAQGDCYNCGHVAKDHKTMVLTPSRRMGKSWKKALMSASTIKPLFIALKTRFYVEFKSGLKSKEYRLYGPRWNEKTCIVGRAVTLSKGYGKSDRTSGYIISFRRVWARELPLSVQKDVLSCYGKLDVEISEIGINTDA